jgi:hypothetical protein
MGGGTWPTQSKSSFEQIGQTFIHIKHDFSFFVLNVLIINSNIKHDIDIDDERLAAV